MTDVMAELRTLQEQAENGSPPEALAASQRLLELLQPLAQESPVKYQSQLAAAWLSYGSSLAATEGLPSAVEPLTTAAGLFREAANDMDAMSLARLIHALLTLAELLLGLEQTEPAQLLLQEARQTGDRIAALEPDVATIVQSRTSRLFASLCLSTGNHRSAVVYGQDAETRFRKLMWQDDSVKPDYASTLQVLALSLSSASVAELREPGAPELEGLAGQPDDKIAQAARKDIDRLLQDASRDDAARWKQAQRKMEDAAVYYRQLSKREPDLYLADYAETTHLLAGFMLNRGKNMTAAGMYEQAVELYGKAAQFDPSYNERYWSAAQEAVQVTELAGNPGRAAKLSRKYGLTA